MQQLLDTFQGRKAKKNDSQFFMSVSMLDYVQPLYEAAMALYSCFLLGIFDVMYV